MGWVRPGMRRSIHACFDLNAPKFNSAKYSNEEGRYENKNAPLSLRLFAVECSYGSSGSRGQRSVAPRTVARLVLGRAAADDCSDRCCSTVSTCQTAEVKSASPSFQVNGIGKKERPQHLRAFSYSTVPSDDYLETALA